MNELNSLWLLLWFKLANVPINDDDELDDEEVDPEQVLLGFDADDEPRLADWLVEPEDTLLVVPDVAVIAKLPVIWMEFCCCDWFEDNDVEVLFVDVVDKFWFNDDDEEKLLELVVNVDDELLLLLLLLLFRIICDWSNMDNDDDDELVLLLFVPELMLLLAVVDDGQHWELLTLLLLLEDSRLPLLPIAIGNNNALKRGWSSGCKISNIVLLITSLYNFFLL